MQTNDEKAKKEAQEWLSLDIELGIIFKKRLIITPQSISYAGVSLPMEKITAIRWGILVEYRNFLKAGTSYGVWLGTPDNRIHIECGSQSLYDMILERLWKTVCLRLINESLNKLSRGEKLRFGEITMAKDGFLLKKRKFFTSEPYYVKWKDISFGLGPGYFYIQSSKDKNIKAWLSYRDVDNVHILEAVTGFIIRSPSLLGES